MYTKNFNMLLKDIKEDLKNVVSSRGRIPPYLRSSYSWVSNKITKLTQD